jgi:S-adenosylmethionine hydrolase
VEAVRSDLVLMTDFGLKDGAVAAMKGVARGVSPHLSVVDLTHEIPPFQIWEAAYRLRQTAPYWPSGTVFVIVVDPGVGTARMSLAARDKDGRVFVCPDNGTLTLMAEEIGLESIREIDEIAHRLPGSDDSYTFLGRDLYAFVGARLAAGELNFEDVGPVIEHVALIPHQSVRTLENAVIGGIPVLDVQYGNIWTNIHRSSLERLGVQMGDRVLVVIRQAGQEKYREVLPFVKSFGLVAHGERLLYVNSLLKAGLAMNGDNFARHFGISSGTEWTVELHKVS